MFICPHCKGAGERTSQGCSMTWVFECQSCDGSGFISVPRYAFDPAPRIVRCTRCCGSGKKLCTHCYGTTINPFATPLCWHDEEIFCQHCKGSGFEPSDGADDNEDGFRDLWGSEM